MEIIKVPELLKDLSEWRTLVFLVIVAVFGILGSFAKKYTTDLKDRKSDISYIIVGSMAAIAVLLVITPKSAVMLISLSIAAGYGGSAVLDNLGIVQRLTKELEDTKLKKKKEIAQIKGDVIEIDELNKNIKVNESMKGKAPLEEEINLGNKLSQLRLRLDALLNEP